MFNLLFLLTALTCIIVAVTYDETLRTKYHESASKALLIAGVVGIGFAFLLFVWSKEFRSGNVIGWILTQNMILQLFRDLQR